VNAAPGHAILLQIGIKKKSDINECKKVGRNVHGPPRK